jgi:uncharacterized protein YjbI with pentapeptide repeats
MRPAPLKVVRAPRLSKHLDARAVTRLESGELVENCRLDNCTLSREEAQSVRFDGVHIVAGALDETKLASLMWLDVTCERCNLSMVDWRASKLTRVLVRGCRITGGKFAECALDSVRFVDCQIDYVSFEAASFRQVIFESCQLREADFHGADLAGTSFEQCDLKGAEFSRAKLQGVDISSSTLGGITVGQSDVRGLIVSRAQASEFAKLFGLVVRD